MAAVFSAGNLEARAHPGRRPHRMSLPMLKVLLRPRTKGGSQVTASPPLLPVVGRIGEILLSEMCLMPRKQEARHTARESQEQAANKPAREQLRVHQAG